jgi:hypothetical protein
VPRKLKSGGDAHDFTPEDRAKGGRARAGKIRERKRAVREAVLEEAVEGAETAIKTLRALLDGDVTDAVRLRASTEMLQLWLELCEWSEIDERIAAIEQLNANGAQ